MRGTTTSSHQRMQEIVGIALIAITILLFLALVTDGYKSEARRPIEGMAEVSNMLGKPGAIIAGIGSIIFGGAVHVLYFLTLIWGAMLLRHDPLDRPFSRIGGALLLMFSIAAMMQMNIVPNAQGDYAGGVIGGFFGSFLFKNFGVIGANVIAATLALIGILLSTDLLVLQVVYALRVVIVAVAQFASSAIARCVNTLTGGAKSAWNSRRAIGEA